MVYERQGQPDEAEKAYRKALEARLGEDAAWDFLTRLYCRSGRAARQTAEQK